MPRGGGEGWVIMRVVCENESMDGYELRGFKWNLTNKLLNQPILTPLLQPLKLAPFSPPLPPPPPLSISVFLIIYNTTFNSTFSSYFQTFSYFMIQGVPIKLSDEFKIVFV